MGRYDASHLRFRIAERGGYDAGVMDFNRAFGAAMKAAFAEGI
jgi:hypothetical protein